MSNGPRICCVECGEVTDSAASPLCNPCAQKIAMRFVLNPSGLAPRAPVPMAVSETPVAYMIEAQDGRRHFFPLRGPELPTDAVLLAPISKSAAAGANLADTGPTDAQRLDWLGTRGQAVRSASNGHRNLIVWRQAWPEEMGGEPHTLRSTIDRVMARESEKGAAHA